MSNSDVNDFLLVELKRLRENEVLFHERLNDVRDEVLKHIDNKTSQITQDVRAIDRRLDLHIQRTQLQLENIAELDERQNEILEKHHQRSDQLAKDNKLRESAIRSEYDEKLREMQKPFEWIKTTSKVIMYAITVGAALFGCYQLIMAFVPNVF